MDILTQGILGATVPAEDGALLSGEPLEQALRRGGFNIYGRHTEIAAHGNVAQAATPVYPAEGEAIVLRPTAGGAVTVIARVTPAQWQQLREAHAAPR